MPSVSALPLEDVAAIVECTNIILLCTDTSGCIVEFNRKAADITGFKREEAIGKPFLNFLIADEWQQKVRQLFDAASQGIEAVNHTVAVKTKDGRLRQLLLNTSLRTDGSGNAAGVVAAGHDMTDARWPSDCKDSQDAEDAELEKVVDDLKRVIETANTPFFFADTHGKVTEWNQMAARMSGYGKEEAVGKDLVETFVPD